MTVDEFRDLISRNQWDTLFFELKKTTPNDENWQTQVVMLESRYRQLKQNSIIGVSTSKEEDIENTQLRKNLLFLINTLPNSSKTSVSLFSSKTITKIVVLLIGAIAILANLTTILDWLGIKPKSGYGSEKPFTVVFYTHGKNGRQDILQLRDTKIIADFGGRREIAKVGDNGQNIFAEIPPSFYGKKIGIGLSGSEGYILTFPDSIYLLNGEPIYIGVQSSCRFCTITGNVRNQTQFIRNAIVSTGNYSDTTKVNGYFEIHVPPQMEKSEYGVTVRINNKIVWDKFITPNLKQPAEILINN